jgi:uncharacterized protein (UPF0261 family)
VAARARCTGWAQRACPQPLIASATSPIALREKVAHEIVHRLAQAKSHTALILPLKGVETWDLPGEPLHDPEGLGAFVNAVQAAASHVKIHCLSCISWTRT